MTPSYILEEIKPYQKQPDLVDARATQRLISNRYASVDGEPRDGRPTIFDPDTGSMGKVCRVMKWASDAVGATGERRCCLRFEVQVKKPGKRAHHQIGDIVIWSLSFDEAMNHDGISNLLTDNKVYAKELRASLIRDGFPEEAKRF